MPALADARQDLYCQHRARSMIPAKAAIAAGYASGSGITTKLESDPEIVSRISELMEEIQLRRTQAREAAITAAKTVGESTGLTRAWLLQQLVENAVLARQEGDFKESNAALKLIGDEYGMFKGGQSLDDLEHTSETKHIDLDATEAVLGKLFPQAPKQISEQDAKVALDLITGNRKPTAVRVGERELSTGSETDAALKPDAEAEIEADTTPEADPKIIEE